MSGLLASVFLTSAAQAETTVEIAYGLGQFVGAAVYCKVPQADVTAFVGPLLEKNGVSTDGPSADMTSFQKGVTAGVEEMAEPNAAPCSTILAKFNEAKTGSAPADRQDAQSFQLRTQFTGKNRCLDIVNDGRNNKVIMAACGKLTGQMWHVTPAGDGAVRLTTEFTGNKACLDVVNDGKNDKLTMASCDDVSGQMWTRVATNPKGSVQLVNAFTGRKKCLDIVNDGRNNTLTMATCGDYSGQTWTLSPQQ